MSNDYRATSLNAYQETVLIAFREFIDSKLINVSHEKRGVALHISTILLKLAPPEQFPVVLTRPLIRLVLAARANKKHTLHDFVLGSIQSWKEAAGNSSLLQLL